jgi:hypothetical protein
MIAIFLMLKMIPFHHGDTEAQGDAIRELAGTDWLSSSLYFSVSAT